MSYKRRSPSLSYRSSPTSSSQEQHCRRTFNRRGIGSKQRVLGSGEMLGGGAFGRGALYHLLQNRIYIGEVVHRGVAYPGMHEGIVDGELWSAVQAKLRANRGAQRRARIETGALLAGLIFDDRGNPMSPSYSVRRVNRFFAHSCLL